MDFIEALKKAREGYPPQVRWHVVVTNHNTEYVLNCGSTFALEKDGNICGLCKAKGSNITGSDILAIARESGGTKTQAFGRTLFEFYTKNGFRPISWIEFNPKRCPPDWKPEYGKEPLIFYAYDTAYHPNRKYNNRFFLFLTSTTPCKTEEDAYYERDEWMYKTEKKRKKQKRKYQLKIKKQRKENENGNN